MLRDHQSALSLKHYMPVRGVRNGWPVLALLWICLQPEVYSFQGVFSQVKKEPRTTFNSVIFIHLEGKMKSRPMYLISLLLGVENLVSEKFSANVV